MDLNALKTELITDPDARGYSGMSDEQAAADLNVVRVNQNKSSMTAGEIYDVIDDTEWAALTPAQQQEIWDILHIGDVNPFGKAAGVFIRIFGGESTTITTLASLRKTQISKAADLGFKTMRAGTIAMARAL